MKQRTWRTLTRQLGMAVVSLFLAFDCFSVARALGAQPPKPNSPEDREVQQLIARLLPDRSNSFAVEFIPADAGRDVFEIESRDGKIVLRGNKGVSVAAGLNWYLRVLLRCPFLPQRASNGASEELASRRQQGAAGQPGPLALFPQLLLLRIFAGLVRLAGLGKLIDWMALNGINAPLSVTGQEAVWREAASVSDSPTGICGIFWPGRPICPSVGWGALTAGEALCRNRGWIGMRPSNGKSWLGNAPGHDPRSPGVHRTCPACDEPAFTRMPGCTR